MQIFKQDLILILMMMVVRSPWIDLSFQMKLENKTKSKISRFMNIFQPWFKNSITMLQQFCKNQYFTQKYGCPNWRFCK
jgi:hypothetical protein